MVNRLQGAGSTDYHPSAGPGTATPTAKPLSTAQTQEQYVSNWWGLWAPPCVAWNGAMGCYFTQSGMLGTTWNFVWPYGGYYPTHVNQYGCYVWSDGPAAHFVQTVTPYDAAVLGMCL